MERKLILLLGPQPRAVLRLPWAIIISSLQDFSMAHSARIVSEGVMKVEESNASIRARHLLTACRWKLIRHFALGATLIQHR